MKLENPGKVFIESLSGNHTIQVFEKVEVKKEVTLNVELITEMFDNGAPILKYFDDNPKTTKYTFKPRQVIDLIDHHYENETYWFDNGIWFKADVDTEDLLDKIDPQK